MSATRSAVPYGVLLVPLRDGAGDPLGVIMAASDFSGSRAASGRALVWQLCIAVFAIVILAGTALVVIRGFLLRPLDVLDRRAAALAAGERTTARRADRQVLRRDRPPRGSPRADRQARAESKS